MGVWGRFRGKRRGSKILERRRRVVSWADALERYGEAAGIAQEGQTEQARGLVLEHLSEPRKILVVTGQEGGSAPLRNYASSLAARMGCEVWHLVCSRAGSTSTLRRSCLVGTGGPHEEIFLEGDVGSCIQQALGHLKRVEFVLMEKEGPERLEVPVTVFTLLNQA